MKLRLLATLLFSPYLCFADPALTPLWQTENLRTPESVLLIGQGADGYMFVSEIEGAGNAVDGKGGIAKLDYQGKIIAHDWLRGLNAPKGMATMAGQLVVSDLTEVLFIDIASATIVARVAVPDSVFLNDVTIDGQGAVYVSDTRTNKVHRIIDGKAEVYLADVKAANGLTFAEGTLYVAGGDTLWRVNQDKSLSEVARGFAENADGLEMIGPNEFIVSCWAGIVYHVKDGQLTTLLDTRKSNKNTADIAWNAQQHILLIPTFNAHSVDAYALTDQPAALPH